MTDHELIKALREDAPRIGWLGWGRPNDVGKKMADAADRLEALLAENERLKAGVQMAVELDPDTGSFSIGFQQPRPKWVSVSERLPELTEEEKYWIEQLGTEVAPEFIVVIKGAISPTVLRFDGEKWFDDDNTWYRVAYWCNLPEPPSTEEVE